MLQKFFDPVVLLDLVLKVKNLYEGNEKTSFK